MLGTEERARVYRFGIFELHSRSGELRKHGVRVKLQDQPREILLLLLEHPGEVVSREQIQKHLWPGKTFVDFDNAINSAMRKLREALGDTAENPRFVETLARRGYRFIAEVSPSLQAAPAVAPATFPKRAIAAGGLAIVLTVIGVWKVTNKVPELSANIRSVAVLPFVDHSPSGNQEYFAEGMTEALITSLAKSPGLRVVSHTSVMQFKHPQRSLPEIARLLKVDGIVEGSVSREGDLVRITAKLVDGRTDLNLWSNSYRRDIGDVLGLQEEVAETITRAIGGRVSRTGRPAVAVRLKPEALDSYLKARKLVSYRTQEQLEQSIGR